MILNAYTLDALIALIPVNPEPSPENEVAVIIPEAFIFEMS
jgi:hypothetical protein